MRSHFVKPLRRGFTTIELMTVLVIFGAVAAVGAPRVAQAIRSTEIHTAHDQVASYVSTARDAAMTRLGTARFNAVSNEIWVSIDSSGVAVPITEKVRLDERYGARLTGTETGLTFDAQGFVRDARPGTNLVIALDDRSSSLCVTRVGKVLHRACAS
jgi:prepilin-type N-terminal cleavage/methylation domain-containing protein